MNKDNKQENMHLDVYTDHSILYYEGSQTMYEEGAQSKEAQERFSSIQNKLNEGYLERVYDNCLEEDYSEMDDEVIIKIKNLINGVTSEVGRALVGLTFLQLAIKSLSPEQSIRLHKGSNRSGSFSWVEGISMRTLDKQFNTPFLREKGLLNINADGIMMTRSLAENYPYSKLYKAEMRGPIEQWKEIVDLIESGDVIPSVTLSYMMAELRNKSINLQNLADKAIEKVDSHLTDSFIKIEDTLIKFFSETKYSARAYEVVIHGFMQAFCEMGLTEHVLVPLSQMRSANKKHGNVGDVELVDAKKIVESWDAKYGKTYLYDELSELKDKLDSNPGVITAGFVVNDNIDIREEITERVNDYSLETGVDILLFNFKDWVEYKLHGVSEENRNQFGILWLKAVVESFSRKRLAIAPIDEPCEEWLNDLINLL